MNDYLIENFVNTKPGEPYRLFPFGALYKNGVKRDITPEYAAQFKLPHFKPAIKLGSHEDATPAGGHIVGLEVRADGLYAITEMNDKGAGALQEGAYRYHSPEVVWGDGYEDPTTGQTISGPLIVGDALLHTPHLGESAALYTWARKPSDKLSVDVGIDLFQGAGMAEQIMALLNQIAAGIQQLLGQNQPEKPEGNNPPPPGNGNPPPPPPGANMTTTTQAETFSADEFKALKAANEQLTATLKAENDRREKATRVEKFGAAIKDTKVANQKDVAELLAGLPDETANAIVTQFKALSEQIKGASLFVENGTSAKGQNGSDSRNAARNLDIAVKAKMSEKKIDNYNAALELVRAEQPELYTAYITK